MRQSNESAGITMVSDRTLRLKQLESAYQGTPPWDIGRIQPALAELVTSREIRDPVLDLGCGTGDLSIYLARKGYAVIGIDITFGAIRKASAKDVPPKARFIVADALRLSFKIQFRTVIDSGLFHLLTDSERPAYASSLADVLGDGGRLFILCFSDKEEQGKPRKIRKCEIEEVFACPWRVDYIKESSFATLYHKNGAKAWLASLSLQTKQRWDRFQPADSPTNS